MTSLVNNMIDEDDCSVKKKKFKHRLYLLFFSFVVFDSVFSVLSMPAFAINQNLSLFLCSTMSFQ